MSREDIQKRFELPERRSKIASLLKQDQDQEVYCVCRSSDSSRFMIACDHCEEWYHGDCIDVTERQARHIRRFYCERCRAADPQLRIRYKTSRSHGEGKSEGGGGESGRSSHQRHEEGPRDRHRDTGCGTCRGCRRTHDCGKCSVCCDSSSKRSGKRRCRRRQCEVGRKPRAEDVSSPKRDARRSADPSGPATGGALRAVARASSEEDELWQPGGRERRRAGPGTGGPVQSAAAKKRRRLESDAEDEEEEESRRKSVGGGGGMRRDRKASQQSAGPLSGQSRQCYGPQCVQEARPGSRYCSDQCGLSLARNRIFQVLPQRIQEWNMTRCVAEEHNTRTLEQIRKRQLEAQAQLERLSRLHGQLDRLVERGRRLAVGDATAGDADDDDETSALHCVTCGHEVSRRLALRHMERCYAKHESQTSFGSLYQTRVEGFNMFCDYYQAATGTYCKRLRVLCPEHCKNPKVGDDESCGCPLLGKNFDPNGQVCRVAKKKCNKHVGWEKLRRAELDMERVRWAMKMDDLMEQERQCRQSMADRAGVLSLMLHSTYDHEIMEKVQNQQRKMAKKSQMHAK